MRLASLFFVILILLCIGASIVAFRTFRMGSLVSVSTTTLREKAPKISDIDFYPSPTFQESKKGFVFKLGNKGQGYYRDGT